MDSGRRVVVDTSRARSSHAVLKMCIEALGWTERSEARDRPDIYWNAVHYSESACAAGGVVNKFPGMVEIVKKVNLGRSLENMRSLYPDEYSFYPRTWFLPTQLQEFKRDAFETSSVATAAIASDANAVGTAENAKSSIPAPSEMALNFGPMSPSSQIAASEVRPTTPSVADSADTATSTVAEGVERTEASKPLEIATGHSNSLPMPRVDGPSSFPSMTSIFFPGFPSSSSSSSSPSPDAELAESERVFSEASSLPPTLRRAKEGYRFPKQQKPPNSKEAGRDWSHSSLPILPPIQSDDDHFRPSPPSVFIVKPDEGSQGEGIYLIQDPRQYAVDSRKKHVVQEYISNPMLLDGFKFDLRVYVVLASLEPLTLYLSKDGLARFCTLPYRRPTSKNIHNPFIHLTNYSVNKKSKNYLHTESSHDGSKRSMVKVFHQLKLLGHDTDLILSQIQRIIIKTMLAILPDLKFESWKQMRHDESSDISCFQILGFDILLTSDCRPILLEVNSSPSLRLDFECDLFPGVTKSLSSPVDEEIKRKLVMDCLLLVDPHERLKRTGPTTSDAAMTTATDIRAPWHKGYNSLVKIHPTNGGAGDEYAKFSLVQRVVQLYLKHLEDEDYHGMNSLAFRSFVKRCKLATACLPQTVLDIIFLETSREMGQPIPNFGSASISIGNNNIGYNNNNSSSSRKNNDSSQLRLQMRDFIQALICISYHRQAPQLWLAERQAYRRHELSGRRSFRQLLSASGGGTAVLGSFEQLLELCETQLAKPWYGSEAVDSRPGFPRHSKSQEDVSTRSRRWKAAGVKSKSYMESFKTLESRKYRPSNAIGGNLGFTSGGGSNSPLFAKVPRRANVDGPADRPAAGDEMKSRGVFLPKVNSLPHLDLNAASLHPTFAREGRNVSRLFFQGCMETGTKKASYAVE